MNIRTQIGIGIKVLVSGVLIYLILRGADFHQIGEKIASASLPLLLVAFSMFFVGYSLTAFRWRLLLGAQGVTARFGYLIRSFMVAMFFNNFLPSTVGGDAVRVYDFCAWAKASRAQCQSSLLIDCLACWR